MDDAALDYDVEECDSESEVEMEDIPPSDSNEDYPYEVFSPEKIVTDMLEKITSISKILEIPKTTTRILLHHFKWDEEKLLEKFYSGDRVALFEAAHTVDPAVIGKNSHKLSVGSTEDCDICLNPLPRNMMTGLECEHRFCSDCWNEYLSVKVMGEGEGLTISCPAHKCDILVDDATAMALIKDPKIRTQYQFLITQSFVECNKLLKLCPTPNCDRVIKVQYIDFKPVVCHCGLTFCFKCNEKWHAPILCEYLKKWLKRIEEDLGTSIWIGSNTKDCPNCGTAIEKNGGCNHMTCRKCKYEFCWICCGNWKTHYSSTRCNRFVSDDEFPGAMSSRLSLKKYLFYYERYMIHLNSFQLEDNLSLMVGEKILELQQMGMSWAEVQFLTDAVNVLRECRPVLMYSYAFAYYLEKSNQSAIFEDNQKDLENATEILSHYLEQDIETEQLDRIKQQVKDRTYYCKSRKEVLLNHVNEGYDNNWWKHVKYS